MTDNKHRGSTLDELLRGEGLLEELAAIAKNEARAADTSVDEERFPSQTGGIKTDGHEELGE